MEFSLQWKAITPVAGECVPWSSQFAWEDIKGGGDKDFNDVVGQVEYLLSQPVGHLKSGSWRQKCGVEKQPAPKLRPGFRLDLLDIGRSLCCNPGIRCIPRAAFAHPLWSLP